MSVGRIVEISQNGRRLSLNRGFIVVSDKSAEIGRIPIDATAAVIGAGHGITYSGNLLHALTERGIPLVFCGPNFLPSGMTWSVSGHHYQSKRIAAQISATEPLKKRIWQALVRAKIANQGAVLDAAGVKGSSIQVLHTKVKSGDPDNVEAQAAQRYWPLLMGKDFRRDQNATGPNSFLNYGYTIIRSAVARAVMAAGLHPTLGICHSNRGNPMCLVDDLMEPFRPYVDFPVMRLKVAGHVELTPEIKERLVSVLSIDLQTKVGRSPLSTCIQRLATSVAISYEKKNPELELPNPPLPLDWPEAE